MRGTTDGKTQRRKGGRAWVEEGGGKIRWCGGRKAGLGDRGERGRGGRAHGDGEQWVVIRDMAEGHCNNGGRRI